MIYKDFLNLKSSEIKNNPTLLGLFIQAFEDVMKRTPICSGCSLNSEYDSFLNEVARFENREKEIILNTKNITKMNKGKTFTLSINATDSILAYVDEKGNDRRKFVERLTDEFVNDYLTHGTDEEIELRKKKFSKFPDSFEKTEDLEDLEAVKTEDELLRAEAEAKELEEKEAEQKEAAKLKSEAKKAKEKAKAEKELKAENVKKEDSKTEEEEIFIDPNQTTLI